MYLAQNTFAFDWSTFLSESPISDPQVFKSNESDINTTTQGNLLLNLMESVQNKHIERQKVLREKNSTSFGPSVIFPIGDPSPRKYPSNSIIVGNHISGIELKFPEDKILNSEQEAIEKKEKTKSIVTYSHIIEYLIQY